MFFEEMPDGKLPEKHKMTSEWFNRLIDGIWTAAEDTENKRNAHFAKQKMAIMAVLEVFNISTIEEAKMMFVSWLAANALKEKKKKTQYSF